ncbi:MAG TPA: hypothetical protein VN782_10505 [Usitatibacter sp.]|nr:hypothetical protein [Usitatibacter sp.]
MKKKGAILVSLFAASATFYGLAGCAVPSDSQALREEPVYITGSNIARRQPVGNVSAISADAYERAREALNPPIPQVPGGGH